MRTQKSFEAQHINFDPFPALIRELLLGPKNCGEAEANLGLVWAHSRFIPPVQPLSCKHHTFFIPLRSCAIISFQTHFTEASARLVSYSADVIHIIALFFGRGPLK